MNEVIEREGIMNLQLTIENDEIHFNNQEIEGFFSNNDEIKRKLVESLLIQLYREAKLSIGQLGELLGTDYYKAMQLMNEKGIYKLDSLNPQVEMITDNNREALKEKLKTTFNKQ